MAAVVRRWPQARVKFSAEHLTLMRRGRNPEFSGNESNTINSMNAVMTTPYFIPEWDEGAAFFIGW